MTILDLIQNEMKRVGAKDGGEYHGPCPLCGGTDRFHVWPGQGLHGTWWCRGCQKGGDAIQYLRDIEGMGYKSACNRLGVDSNDYDPQALPPVKPVSTFTPTASITPAEKWAEKALKFVDHCHAALLDNRQQCDWLDKRGITRQMAEKYRLGWNAKDYYRERESWGLHPEIKPDGKLKKLWLPTGLVIPWLVDGQLHRLRIRRETGDPRYFVVPGSGRSAVISRMDAAAYVVVESELDAILLDAVAGDLVGVVAQGNSTARPDSITMPVLQNAMHISVALDTDEAGAKASRWWLDQFDTAHRWPVVGGKDPGEAFTAGVDIRSWVVAGLPPAFRVASTVPASPQPQTEPKQASLVTIAKIKDRQIHITDHQPTWSALMDEGKTAYSNHELQRLAKAVELAGPEQAEHAKEILMGIKDVFGGYILKTEAL